MLSNNNENMDSTTTTDNNSPSQENVIIAAATPTTSTTVEEERNSSALLLDEPESKTSRGVNTNNVAAAAADAAIDDVSGGSSSSGASAVSDGKSNIIGAATAAASQELLSVGNSHKIMHPHHDNVTSTAAADDDDDDDDDGRKDTLKTDNTPNSNGNVMMHKKSNNSKKDTAITKEEDGGAAVLYRNDEEIIKYNARLYRYADDDGEYHDANDDAANYDCADNDDDNNADDGNYCHEDHEDGNIKETMTNNTAIYNHTPAVPLFHSSATTTAELLPPMIEIVDSKNNNLDKQQSQSPQGLLSKEDIDENDAASGLCDFSFQVNAARHGGNFHNSRSTSAAANDVNGNDGGGDGSKLTEKASTTTNTNPNTTANAEETDWGNTTIEANNAATSSNDPDKIKISKVNNERQTLFDEATTTFDNRASTIAEEDDDAATPMENSNATTSTIAASNNTSQESMEATTSSTTVTTNDDPNNCTFESNVGKIDANTTTAVLDDVIAAKPTEKAFTTKTAVIWRDDAIEEASNAATSSTTHSDDKIQVNAGKISGEKKADSHASSTSTSANDNASKPMGNATAAIAGMNTAANEEETGGGTPMEENDATTKNDPRNSSEANAGKISENDKADKHATAADDVAANKPNENAPTADSTAPKTAASSERTDGDKAMHENDAASAGSENKFEVNAGQLSGEENVDNNATAIDDVTAKPMKNAPDTTDASNTTAEAEDVGGGKPMEENDGATADGDKKIEVISAQVILEEEEAVTQASASGGIAAQPMEIAPTTPAAPNTTADAEDADGDDAIEANADATTTDHDNNFEVVNDGTTILEEEEKADIRATAAAGGVAAKPPLQMLLDTALDTTTAETGEIGGDDAIETNAAVTADHKNKFEVNAGQILEEGKVDQDTTAVDDVAPKPNENRSTANAALDTTDDVEETGEDSTIEANAAVTDDPKNNFEANAGQMLEEEKVDQDTIAVDDVAPKFNVTGTTANTDLDTTTADVEETGGDNAIETNAAVTADHDNNLEANAGKMFVEGKVDQDTTAVDVDAAKPNENKSTSNAALDTIADVEETGGDNAQEANAPVTTDHDNNLEANAGQIPEEEKVDKNTTSVDEDAAKANDNSSNKSAVPNTAADGGEVIEATDAATADASNNQMFEEGNVDNHVAPADDDELQPTDTAPTITAEGEQEIKANDVPTKDRDNKFKVNARRMPDSHITAADKDAAKQMEDAPTNTDESSTSSDREKEMKADGATTADPKNNLEVNARQMLEDESDDDHDAAADDDAAEPMENASTTSTTDISDNETNNDDTEKPENTRLRSIGKGLSNKQIQCTTCSRWLSVYGYHQHMVSCNPSALSAMGYTVKRKKKQKRKKGKFTSHEVDVVNDLDDVGDIPEDQHTATSSYDLKPRLRKCLNCSYWIPVSDFYMHAEVCKEQSPSPPKSKRKRDMMIRGNSSAMSEEEDGFESEQYDNDDDVAEEDYDEMEEEVELPVKRKKRGPYKKRKNKNSGPNEFPETEMRQCHRCLEWRHWRGMASHEVSCSQKSEELSTTGTNSKKKGVKKAPPPPPPPSESNLDKKHCPFCFGWFKWQGYWMHERKCKRQFDSNNDVLEKRDDPESEDQFSRGDDDNTDGAESDENEEEEEEDDDDDEEDEEEEHPSQGDDDDQVSKEENVHADITFDDLETDGHVKEMDKSTLMDSEWALKFQKSLERNRHHVQNHDPRPCMGCQWCGPKFKESDDARHVVPHSMCTICQRLKDKGWIINHYTGATRFIDEFGDHYSSIKQYLKGSSEKIFSSPGGLDYIGIVSEKKARSNKLGREKDITKTSAIKEDDAHTTMDAPKSEGAAQGVLQFENDDVPRSAVTMMNKRKIFVRDPDPRPCLDCDWCGPSKPEPHDTGEIVCHCCKLLQKEGWTCKTIDHSRYFKNENSKLKFKSVKDFLRKTTDLICKKMKEDKSFSSLIAKEPNLWRKKVALEEIAIVNEKRPKKSSAAKSQKKSKAILVEKEATGTEDNHSQDRANIANDKRAQTQIVAVEKRRIIDLPTIPQLLEKEEGLMGVLRDDIFQVYNRYFGTNANIAAKILLSLCKCEIPSSVSKESPFIRPSNELHALSDPPGPPPTRFIGIHRISKILEDGTMEHRYAVAIPQFFVDYDESPIANHRSDPYYKHNGYVIPREATVKGQTLFLRVGLEDETIAGQLFVFMYRIMYGAKAVLDVLAEYNRSEVLSTFGPTVLRE